MTNGTPGHACRPLTGPDAHPLLQAAAQIETRLRGMKQERWYTAIEQEVQRLLTEKRRSLPESQARYFAETVGFGLREKLLYSSEKKRLRSRNGGARGGQQTGASKSPLLRKLSAELRQDARSRA